MSHQKTAIVEERTFSLATCTLPPTPYIPGVQYRFTGLSQGTLGSYEIVTVALSTTEFDNNVTAIPSTNGEAWQGIFDFTNCRLDRLRDNLSNTVEGYSSIEVFPWFVSTVAGNFVDEASIFLPNTNLIATNNRFTGGSSINFESVTGLLTLDNNIFAGGTEITALGSGNHIYTGSNLQHANLTFTGNSNVTINYSYIIGGTLTSASNNSVSITDSILQRVTATFDQAVNSSVSRSLISASTILFAGTLLGGLAITLTLQGITLASGSTLSAQLATLTGNTLISSSNIRNASTLDIRGTGTLTRLDLSRATFNYTGGAQTDVVIETGTLNNATFTATRIRLENSTSTLAANVTDATKTGYVNALP